MGLLDSLFRRFQKSNAVFTVIGSDISLSYRQEALKNVWVVSAIEAICEALVQMGIRGADAEVFDRGILSRSELIKIITYDLLLNGNAYLLKTDVAGKLALVPLEPTRVRIQISEQIKVSYNDTPINYDELIHIRNVIPNESGNERFLLGDSVIKQIIDIIILDNKIVQLNIANVSTNNLTLIASFKEFVDESVLKRLESHIKRELEQNKKLQFLISPVPMDVKEIQTNSEMLYIQTQRENAIKILSVFRIPPIILGFGDTGNYVNRKEQLRAFYENAVFPVASKIETAFLKHKLDITFNKENVAVLQETIAEKVNTLNALVMTGYSLEQASQMLGLPLPENPIKNTQQSIENSLKTYQNSLKKTQNFYLPELENLDIQNKQEGGLYIKIPIHIYEFGEEIKTKFYQEHIRTTKQLKPKILKLLTENKILFFDKYLADIKRAYEQNNIVAIENLLEQWLSEVDNLTQNYIKDIYMKVLDDFDAVFKWKISNEFIRGISKAVVSKKQAERTTNINKTMFKRIINLSSEYIQKGQPVSELAYAIENEFRMQRNRAIAIARTETTGLLNAYGFEQAVRADAQTKTWLTAHDERVRHTHRLNDYATIRIEDKFQNGLRYPGDPNGKLEEIINCRCTLIFE